MKLLILTALLLNIGCRNVGETKENPAASFLNWEALSKGSARTLAPEDARAMIEQSARRVFEDPIFYQWQQYDPNSPFPVHTNKSACVAAIDASKVAATDNSISIVVNVDFLNCLGSEWANFTGFRRLSLRSVYRMTCANFDFTPYDDLSLGEFHRYLQRSSLCKSSDKVQILRNAQWDYQIDDESQPEPREVRGSRRYALMNPVDNQPCSFSRGTTTARMEQCRIGFYFEETINDDRPTTDIFYADADGLEIDQDQRFFKSGTMNITLNDWSGVVNFSDEAPDPDIDGVRQNFPGYEIKNDFQVLAGILPLD